MSAIVTDINFESPQYCWDVIYEAKMNLLLNIIAN